MRKACWGAALLLVSGCQYEYSSVPADAGPGPFAGAVSFVWAPTSFAATADFTTPRFAAQMGTTPDNCPGRVVGNCCLYAQPQVDIPSGDVEPVTVSAGSIALTDGSNDLGNLDYRGVGYTPLSSAENPGLIWNPGDELIAFAAGATVVPFSGSITAPPAFEGVNPALSVTGQVVVHVADDFTVSWTPDGSDAGANVDVQFFDPVGTYADCSAPEAAGTITAPAGTLSAFTPGDDGYVTLSRPVVQEIQVDNATVTLSAVATDVGLATFQ